MNSKTEHNNVRTLQLLADLSTEGLSYDAYGELAKLLSIHAQFDHSHLEPAAAAIDLAMTPPSFEPLPSGLRSRILSDSGQFLEIGED